MSECVCVGDRERKKCNTSSQQRNQTRKKHYRGRVPSTMIMDALRNYGLNQQRTELSAAIQLPLRNTRRIKVCISQCSTVTVKS